MNTALSEQLRQAIRNVPDFPKPGILFKDITPVLADPTLLKAVINGFVEECKGKGVQKVAGIDARGFLFGVAVALELNVGFVPVRKKGKLPYKTTSLKYTLEYGEAEIEIHTDAINPGEKVVIIDDLLATGGTAGAAVKLIKKMGAEVVQAQFLIELGFLNGRAALEDTPVLSLVRFD